MRILNPLYDWAFKYLMDNNEVAKKFLTVLLKKNVIHLENRNVELPLLKEGNPFLSRFDFKAIIETENHQPETVLIEIQKYKGTNPLDRFRTYLGENYLKQETYKNQEGNTITESLPIIAVYILGYCPPEFKVPYVIVRNEAYDGVLEEKITLESEYVKLLTHTAYFLIVTPPKEYVWRNTSQEALIRLFRQKTVLNESNTIYELEEEPKSDLKEVVNYLSRGAMEEIILKQMKAEEDYYKDLESLEIEKKQLAQEHEQLKGVLEEKEKLLKEEKKRAEEKEKLLEEEKKRAEEKEKLLEEEKKRAEEEKKRAEEKEKLLEEEKKRAEDSKQKIIELAKLLKELNLPIQEIIDKTGLSEKEILNL